MTKLFAGPSYIDRKVTICWPTINFTKMILLETLCTSNSFCIHSSATNTLTPTVPLSFPDQYTWCPCPWLCGCCHHGIWSHEYSRHPLPCGIVFPLPCKLFLSECSHWVVHPEVPQVLAWFATMAWPCLPHLIGGQARDVTNRTSMSVGTA